MCQTGGSVAVPTATLLDDASPLAEVNQFSTPTDALAKHDVELAVAEWGSHLVLHNLHSGFVSYYFTAVLDDRNFAHIDTDAGIELQGISTSGCLRISEHHANLLAQLVDEDARSVGLVDGARELAQCLAHQSGMQTDLVIAHIALNLCLRSECGYGVNHDDVHSARTDELVCDLQCLLTIVWLADEKIVDVHAQILSIEAVKRVLCIDESCHASRLLTFGDGMDGQRRLT